MNMDVTINQRSTEYEVQSQAGRAANAGRSRTRIAREVSQRMDFDIRVHHGQYPGDTHRRQGQIRSLGRQRRRGRPLRSRLRLMH